ncbi:unnamed protein product [Euphydryas editha]|uniref:Uncharacterized protein n=1 Tax=Euphydryas editha TaxID=104508 RepID=A0AAU9UPH2_EUPED|nr:unnamed protein product [Euphydryas editha]
MATTTKLTFYDPETDTAVELILSEEDARRAENDLQFATALMNTTTTTRKGRNKCGIAAGRC